MAKITTTTVIKQGKARVEINSDGGIAFYSGISCFLNINKDPEKVCQGIEDLEHLIEVFKKHITDNH